MKKINNLGITLPRQKTIGAWVYSYFFKFKKPLLILSLSLLIASSAYAVAFRCIPCKQNHYCTGGMRYQCPSDKPVTQVEGTNILADCMTCEQREGTAKPVFEDLLGTDGDCVSCYEYNSDTPVWNGTTCEACPSGQIWENGSCQSSVTCIDTIAHSENGISSEICIAELVEPALFASISPQSAGSETTEFLEKYGISTASLVYPDYWAGAMKYCQDKGLRLPTMSEYISILKSYATSVSTCNTSCEGISYGKLGCCFYDEVYNMNELGYLKGLNIWSSLEYSAELAYTRNFPPEYSASKANPYYRNADTFYALCIR